MLNIHIKKKQNLLANIYLTSILMLLLIISAKVFANNSPSKSIAINKNLQSKYNLINNHDAPPLAKYTNNTILVGKIHYKYWFWEIYDAYLYSNNGSFSWDNDFILKIRYLRDFSSESIIKETIKQIRSQKNNEVTDSLLSKWEGKLMKVIPNIKEKDVLIGIYNVNGLTLFYMGNGQYLGSIKGKLFAKCFFNIWLEDNKDIELSRELRGL